jgi:hypothetical protein
MALPHEHSQRHAEAEVRVGENQAPLPYVNQPEAPHSRRATGQLSGSNNPLDRY